MTSLRKQRARIHRIYWDACRRRLDSMVEDQLWDRMPAVGREFGSPDFDRLMEEDYRLGRGVFDPAVAKRLGQAASQATEELELLKSGRSRGDDCFRLN